MTAQAAASAASTVLWMLLAATVLEGTFTDLEIVTLTGATATVLGWLAGYLIRDPLRG